MSQENLSSGFALNFEHADTEQMFQFIRIFNGCEVRIENSVTIIRIFNGCEVRIEKSVTRGIIRYHKGKPRDAEHFS